VHWLQVRLNSRFIYKKFPDYSSSLLHIGLLTVVVLIAVAVAAVVFCCRCTITSNFAKLNEFLMHLLHIQVASGKWGSYSAMSGAWLNKGLTSTLLLSF